MPFRKNFPVNRMQYARSSGTTGLAVTGNISALVYFKWYRPKAQREERERGEQVEEYPSLFK